MAESTDSVAPGGDTGKSLFLSSEDSTIKPIEVTLPIAPGDLKRYLWYTMYLNMWFFGIYGTFNGLQALQTTFYGDYSYIALALIYSGTFTLGLCAPKICLKLELRNSIIIGCLGYCLIIVSNIAYHPVFYLISAFVGGLTIPIIWTAAPSYAFRCALHYQPLTTKSRQGITSYFSGLFSGSFQFGCAVCNLLSSIFLNYANQKALLYFFLGLNILSTIFLLFLPPVSIPEGGSDIPNVSPIHPLRICWESRAAKFVIPLSIYNGLSLGFMVSDFLVFVVNPLLGEEHGGYIQCVFTGTGTFASFLFGWMASLRRGRRWVVFIAFLTCLIYTIAILIWKIPNTGVNYKYYPVVSLLSIIFGLGNAVWESQISSIFYTLFEKEEDKNTGVTLWLYFQAIGFSAIFALSYFVHSLFIESIVLLVGLFVAYGSILYLDFFIQPIDG